MKLMIVDDHAGVRTMLRQLVASPDDAVFECASGDEAIRSVAVFQPDAITMDVRMPGMCGFEAVRAIRSTHPSARVVMVTSYDEPFLRQAAREAGADGFFLKDSLAGLRGVLTAGALAPARVVPAMAPVASDVTVAAAAWLAVPERAALTGQHAIPVAFVDGDSPVATNPARLREETRGLEAFAVALARDLMVSLQSMQLQAVRLQSGQAALLSPEGRDGVRQIGRGCRELADRLKPLLELAQPAPVRPAAKVELKQLVHESWMDVCPLADRRRFGFRVASLPEVLGERVLLRLLFNSLLDNAVEFAHTRPQPQVEVGGTVVADEAVLFVRDNGVGFDNATAEQLFKPGAATERSRGIGLATAQHIVRRHGGRIWAEGMVDGGATFHFTLPLARKGAAL